MTYIMNTVVVIYLQHIFTKPEQERLGWTGVAETWKAIDHDVRLHEALTWFQADHDRHSCQTVPSCTVCQQSTHRGSYKSMLKLRKILSGPFTPHMPNTQTVPYSKPKSQVTMCNDGKQYMCTLIISTALITRPEPNVQNFLPYAYCSS